MCPNNNQGNIPLSIKAHLLTLVKKTVVFSTSRHHHKTKKILSLPAYLQHIHAASTKALTNQIMNPAAQIAKHLRDVHFGGNWTFSNLREALAGVSWQQATTQVHSLNTIATLVYHIHYYISLVTKVLEGEPLNGSDKYSFNCPPILSQQDWDVSQQPCIFRQRVHDLININLINQKLIKLIAITFIVWVNVHSVENLLVTWEFFLVVYFF